MRLREATYHKAAATTAATAMPVATGSASIPVMREGTILAPERTRVNAEDVNF